jgi:hypothetical protein
MNALTKLNDFLKIFNQESGEYLNLIGDINKPDAIIEGNVKINDFNKGAIANLQEYEMQLLFFLVDQLELDKTTGSNLDYIATTYYNMKRKNDESDASYYSRIVNRVFAKKCTPIAIIKAISQYGTSIELIEGIGSGAFSDVSFSDNTEDFAIPGFKIIKGAYCEALGGRAYFFRIMITGLKVTDYKNIINTINEYKAGGINYFVEISDTTKNYIGFSDTTFCNYNLKKFNSNPVVTQDFAT